MQGHEFSEEESKQIIDEINWFNVLYGKPEDEWDMVSFLKDKDSTITLKSVFYIVTKLQREAYMAGVIRGAKSVSEELSSVLGRGGKDEEICDNKNCSVHGKKVLH
jgi:hypothetical protein